MGGRDRRARGVDHGRDGTEDGDTAKTIQNHMKVIGRSGEARNEGDRGGTRRVRMDAYPLDRRCRTDSQPRRYCSEGQMRHGRQGRSANRGVNSLYGNFVGLIHV
jgi:hypothetical protein